MTMRNIDHIRALATDELAGYLGFHCMFRCGDCPAFLFPNGMEDPCPAFLTASERQMMKTGNTRVTETHRFVSRDECYAHMEKWLEAEGDDSLWEWADHMQEEAGT